eukprot:scaffold36832_cov19-Tisochrysis_lutea.AAC.1
MSEDGRDGTTNRNRQMQYSCSSVKVGHSLSLVTSVHIPEPLVQCPYDIVKGGHSLTHLSPLHMSLGTSLKCSTNARS